MDNSSAQFDAEDLAALEAARLEHEAENPPEVVAEDAPAPAEAAPVAAPVPAADAPAPSAPAPAPSPSPAPAAPAPAEVAATPAPAAPAPTDPSVHAALRITRRENERLARELEELKKLVPAPKPLKLDDSVKEDLKEYAPEAAAHIDQLERQNAELKAATPAPAPATPEFTPVKYDASTQEAIDAVPDLLKFQVDPDQTAFKLAKAADALLEIDPAWVGKSLVERFAEAARITNERLGRSTATPPPPAPQAGPSAAEKAAAIARAAAATGAPAVSIGDLRGGETPTNDTPDYHKMTDEDIIASLE